MPRQDHYSEEAKAIISLYNKIKHIKGLKVELSDGFRMFFKHGKHTYEIYAEENN